MADRAPDYLKKIFSSGKPDNGTSKKPRINFVKFLSISLIVILALMAAFLGFFLAIFSKLMLFEALLTLMPGEKFLGATNVLVLGVDNAGSVNRSDTIMVANINPQKNTVSIVSIPRDTRVDIPGRGQDKINHAFAYGGIELTKKSVEEFLGIKVPYHVVIDIKGLENVINEVGGVTINVEKKMYYVDYSQNLFVDLKPGIQHMAGKDAVSYLRYRADGGDLNRIMRQQNFIQAFGSQITSKENVLHSPGILMKLLSCMDTNLSTRQVLGLALNMRKVNDFGRIKMTSLAGFDSNINGISYIIPDAPKVAQIVSEYLKD